MTTVEISKRAALLVCVALLSATLLMGQAGSLDPSFGAGGIVTTPNTTTGCGDVANCALAIQSDGKILVAGGASASNGAAELAVARYNANGTLDSTFGTGGIVTTSQDSAGSAFAVALQPDEKIVVGSSGGLNLLVVRFNTNGSLDTTFGSGGIASLRPFNELFFGPFPGGIAVESSGDILVAAQTVVVRLRSNGQLDSSFGTGGAANLLTSAQALLLLPSNKLLVVSSLNFSTGGESRYNSAGSLDASFGVAGQTPSLGLALAIVAVSNGKFVVAGTLDSGVASNSDTTQGFVLLRYDGNGTIDASFGSRGAALTSFPGEGYSAAMALAVQSNGDIVAAGVTEAKNPAFGQEPSDFALARYTTNGQLDTTFGSNGLVTTAIGLGGSSASASAVAIQSDGKIVVAGKDVPPAFGDPGLGFVLARYLAQQCDAGGKPGLPARRSDCARSRLRVNSRAVTPTARSSLFSLLLVLAPLLLSRQPAMGASYSAPKEGDFVIRDFRFGNGETLPELRIHYATLGSLRRDAGGAAVNAVLILHGTGGAWNQFTSLQFADVLFGPGQLLDANRYFIILPDSIGHGASSKPSDGLKGRFPHYDYDDMVAAQHRLLTEGLGVNHLRLVMGTSMGCMHSWVWGETYPDMMDAFMPLACLPAQIAGRNRVLRRAVMDSIRLDPAWKDGQYTEEPLQGIRSALYLLLIATSSPLQWQKNYPTRDQADKFLNDYIDRRLHMVDANDMLYAVDASRNYDPSPNLEKIKAPVMFINSADDFINPPELGIAEREIKRVPHGQFHLLPITGQTRGHGTHTVAAVWKQYLQELLQESEPKQ